MTEETPIPSKEELRKLLNKAKMGLLIKGAVFVSTITFSMKHEFTDSVETAATDGIVFKYNPTFFAGLTDDARISLLMHETSHIMFMHPVRRGNRDHKVYNIAGDIVIDTYLSSVGYNQKEYGCVRPQYTNWTTAQVYDDLLDNPNKGPSKPRMADLQGNGSGEALTPQQQEQLEESIKTILVKASTQSKLMGEKPGNIPGEVEKLIENLINPKLDWAELLSRFMDNFAKDDYTWKKPNRRFLPTFYLPSLYSEQLGEITVAIDTSGSIDDKQMTGILSELQHVYVRYKPSKMTILDCDTAIHNIHEVDPYGIDSILDLKFTGGGGTKFEPVIEYCKEYNTRALIYFTDLHARQITEEQDFPILWICYSNAKPSPTGETVYYYPTDA